jgi:hypothetical protein
LAKLAQLRQRGRRYKPGGGILTKLRSPHLDKALTFLDDKLLPSTSNAVERGNRCATSAKEESDSSVVRNCERDEGRPLGVGVQAQAPNPLTRLCTERAWS